MTLVCPICGTGVSRDATKLNFYLKHMAYCCPHYVDQGPYEMERKPVKKPDRGPLLPMFPDGMQPVKGKDYD